MDCAQTTAAQVDREVKSLLDSALTDALRILREHRGLLDEVSEYLLVKETITGDELMAYVNAEAASQIEASQEVPHPTQEPAAPSGPDSAPNLPVSEQKEGNSER